MLIEAAKQVEKEVLGILRTHEGPMTVWDLLNYVPPKVWENILVEALVELERDDHAVMSKGCEYAITSPSVRLKRIVDRNRHAIGVWGMSDVLWGVPKHVIDHAIETGVIKDSSYREAIDAGTEGKIKAREWRIKK